MSLQTQILLYLGIYFLVILIFSIFISKKQTENDFLISSRNRGWFSIGMSKFATSIGAVWFISYTAYIYQYWIGTLALLLGFIIWLFILWYYIWPKLAKIWKEKEFLKIWDIVYFKTKSKKLSEIINFLGSFMIFCWAFVWVVGWAKLIEYFWFLSYELSVVAIILFVLSYIIFIWYKWVITTDIIQTIFILTILFLIIGSFYFNNNLSTFDFGEVQFDELSISTIVWFLIYWIFSSFSYIDRYQILLSWKDEKNIKKGFLFAVPLMIIAVILLFVIWFFIRFSEVWLDPSLVFLKAIESYIPQVIIPFAIVMFFASIMSSLDSYLYWISSHFNILKIKNKVTNIRINSFILSIFILIVSIIFNDIIDITVFATWFALVLSVPMIYIFFWKNFEKTLKNKSRMLFSIIFSVIWLFVWIALFWLNPTIALFPLVFWAIWLLLNIERVNSYLK